MICKHCQIEFLNSSGECPFCKMALTGNPEREEINPYPNVVEKERFKRKSKRLVFFVLLFLEIIFVIINLRVNDIQTNHWSVLIGGIFAYAYFTFGRILFPKAGHIMEITMQAVAIFLLLMFIEWNVGWKGWSLSIGLPIINAVLLFLTLLLMLVNRKNWQTYLLLLLFSLLTAIVNMVLAFVGISASFVLCCGVFAAALFLFFGALFLGERTASNELKWKFHI